MIIEANFWPVLLLLVSILVVNFGTAFFVYSKKNQITRQIGAVWFGIGLALTMITLANLITVVFQVSLRELVFGIIIIMITTTTVVLLLKLRQNPSSVPRQ
jgi:hypothetical protein